MAYRRNFSVVAYVITLSLGLRIYSLRALYHYNFSHTPYSTMAYRRIPGVASVMIGPGQRGYYLRPLRRCNFSHTPFSAVAYLTTVPLGSPKVLKSTSISAIRHLFRMESLPRIAYQLLRPMSHSTEEHVQGLAAMYRTF
jgi:hypothetical protein